MSVNYYYHDNTLYFLILSLSTLKFAPIKCFLLWKPFRAEDTNRHMYILSAGDNLTTQGAKASTVLESIVLDN